MVENLLNQLEKTNNEVLFKSLPMRLALSKLAKYDYTGGNERIKIGCLSDGFCILARGRDYQKFVETDAIYYPSYGRLVPAHVSEPDFLAGNYDDPFAETTYAVFKVRMKKTRIDPAFNFGT
jgi:poly-D-alanine transfer protein DltD